jgi:hypothetical protein
MAKPNIARATKVGTGKADFLTDVDGRSIIARRFKEIYSDLIDDLGGNDTACEAQRQLARRAATLAVQCEVMECGLGDVAFDGDVYAKMTNTLNRVLTTLGLRRSPRDTAVRAAIDAHAQALMDG